MKNIISAVPLALFLILSGAAARRLPQHSIGEKNEAGTFIVGGREATQGEVPYQLTLKIRDTHICGASLVEIQGLQIGITAAHCVDDEYKVCYDTIAGDINFADTTGIEQSIPVGRIIIHENFNSSTMQNDIALVFLNGTYILNENINTVALPTQGQVTAEGNLTVSGWGHLWYFGTIPDELHIAEIPIVDDATCQQAYENNTEKVTDDMICTGVETGNVSPCNGDSGGPAISGAGYLAGIVSWACPGCGLLGYPTVYTKVSHYVDWIHSTVASYKNSLN